MNLPEVQVALLNQRVYQTVHDRHQNQDQDRVDSLVEEKNKQTGQLTRVSNKYHVKVTSSGINTQVLPASVLAVL